MGIRPFTFIISPDEMTPEFLAQLPEYGRVLLGVAGEALLYLYGEHLISMEPVRSDPADKFMTRAFLSELQRMANRGGAQSLSSALKTIRQILLDPDQYRTVRRAVKSMYSESECPDNWHMHGVNWLETLKRHIQENSEILEICRVDTYKQSSKIGAILPAVHEIHDVSNAIIDLCNRSNDSCLSIGKSAGQKYMKLVDEIDLQLYESVFEWEELIQRYGMENFIDPDLEFSVGIVTDAFFHHLEVHWQTEYGVSPGPNEGAQGQAQEKKRPGRPKRNEYELTQYQAAIIAGVAVRTIQKWESGNAPPAYPGRRRQLDFTIWAKDYRSRRAARRETRNANRAVGLGSLDDYPAEEED